MPAATRGDARALDRRLAVSHVFELTDSGGQATVVRFTLDLQLAGLMKLMTPMIARQVRREVAQLETLKRCLSKPFQVNPLSVWSARAPALNPSPMAASPRGQLPGRCVQIAQICTW